MGFRHMFSSAASVAESNRKKKRAVNGSDMELVYCWFYFFVCAGTRDLGTCALCSDR